MNEDDIQRLLRITEENNAMLKERCSHTILHKRLN